MGWKVWGVGEVLLEEYLGSTRSDGLTQVSTVCVLVRTDEQFNHFPAKKLVLLM